MGSRSVTQSEAFAERFNDREVNCFHRCIANGCDRVLAGAGLLSLYFTSRERACGRYSIPPNQQSGLESAMKALARVGVRSRLNKYDDVEKSVAALPSTLGMGTILIIPAGSTGLSFLARRSEDVAHYLLVTATMEDRFVFLESPSSVGDKRGGALSEVESARSELETAMYCYARTTGSVLDSWGESWQLWLDTETSFGWIGRDEIMKSIVSDALEMLTDPEGVIGKGFDVSMTAEVEKSFECGGGGNDANAVCRAYLRDANFATVHLRALSMAIELLSQSRAEEAWNLTSQLIKEVTAARSRYLIKVMLDGTAVGREGTALCAQVDALWDGYALRMRSLLAYVLVRRWKN